jgi:hypothetical protein
MSKSANIVAIRTADHAKPPPPQTFKPSRFRAQVRAELVMQPLSG